MERKQQLLAFLKESPEDPFLLYALAQEELSSGNDEAAETQFNKLLALHPDYVATYYHLGKLLHRRGDKDTAKLVFANGMEVAKSARDQHSLAELQSALLEIEYEDD